MNRVVLTIIILLCASAYGSLRVLNNTLPQFNQDWFVYSALWISPWILFIGSLKSWHQCYVWRSILDKRKIEPILSRGGYTQEKIKTRPHMLEYICCAFFILSLAAIMKLFSVPHIGWSIGSLAFSYFILRLALKNI
ncbi:MAG: hypothetical protein ACRBCS_06560 [Cellvibrionaceae bacterium]